MVFVSGEGKAVIARTSLLYTVLIALIFFLTPLTPTAQETPTQTPGWQGHKSQQQTETVPAPQHTGPSAPQVLEIPPAPQPQSSLQVPQQELAVPRKQWEPPTPPQLVTVTVTDQNGNYVAGLQPEDFTLYENEVPQKISYFNTGQHEPVSLGLLIDTSGSMARKLSRAVDALRSFISSIHPEDDVFLLEFNHQPALLQDFTDSRPLLSKALTLLRAGGGTALYDAVFEGLRRVRQGRHAKRAILVITDGMDTASFSSLRRVVESARRAGVLIYTIGIGNPQGRGGGGLAIGIGPFVLRGGSADERVDARTLQLLSEETGGKNFILNPADVVGSAAVLSTAVDTISTELRQQYSLGYASSHPDSEYRSLRVETSRRDLSVRTQKGMAAEHRDTVGHWQDRNIPRLR